MSCRTATSFFSDLMFKQAVIQPLLYALVAQLDRALDSDSKGRWFESSQARQKNGYERCIPQKPRFYRGFSALRVFSAI